MAEKQERRRGVEELVRLIEPIAAQARANGKVLTKQGELLVRLDERSQRTELDILEVKKRLDDGHETFSDHGERIAVVEDRTETSRYEARKAGGILGLLAAIATAIAAWFMDKLSSNGGQ